MSVEEVDDWATSRWLTSSRPRTHAGWIAPLDFQKPSLYPNFPARILQLITSKVAASRSTTSLIWLLVPRGCVTLPRRVFSLPPRLKLCVSLYL